MAQANGNSAPKGAFKRIIVCCDGTWVNSLSKSSSSEPPTNVTRIARAIKQTGVDGTHQIISYHPGVGTGATFTDQITGGAFGMGLDSDIRDVYNFICNNYCNGDDIFLIGFSRGAFTARSVASLIAWAGLLTPDGLDHFYDIFNDFTSMGDSKMKSSDYLMTDIEPYAGQEGKQKIEWAEKRKEDYRAWLKERNWTRDTYQTDAGEKKITMKAIGVWDTVGTLGIPPASLIGIHGWKFTDTQISPKVENAFQALAMDEPRLAFAPCLWERLEDNTTTNLKQVWFPGNHGAVGGGWHDQQIADIALAWMCDQLSSVGIDFSHTRLTHTFMSSLAYAAAHPHPYVPQSPWNPLSWFFLPAARRWALETVNANFDPKEKRDASDCTRSHPPDEKKEKAWERARAWGLGQLRYPTSKLQLAAGILVRQPGLFMRPDEATSFNSLTNDPLSYTNERIHSCVRIRLACQGLGMDDNEAWKCESLTRDKKGRPLWKLEHKSGFTKAQMDSLSQFVPSELLEVGTYPADVIYSTEEGDGQWRWVYVGSAKPFATVLPEEPLVGYWEKYLLALTTGHADVWRWAEKNPPAFLIKE